MDASACFACTNTAAATLPGWLVLLPTTHVVSYADLSDAAAAELGPLLLDLSRALPRLVDCVKTYQMLFAEAEGFAHLHLHLVPRPTDLAPELKGPGVFGFLGRPEDEWVPTERMDELGRQLRELIPAR
jgi:diadenosine tetraphosphate (Ap4A) HIT family hydrolase